MPCRACESGTHKVYGMEYIARGSKNQNDSNLNLLCSERAKMNERRFNLFLQVSICFYRSSSASTGLHLLLQVFICFYRSSSASTGLHLLLQVFICFYRSSSVSTGLHLLLQVFICFYRSSSASTGLHLFLQVFICFYRSSSVSTGLHLFLQVFICFCVIKICSSKQIEMSLNSFRQIRSKVSLKLLSKSMMNVSRFTLIITSPALKTNGLGNNIRHQCYDQCRLDL